MNAPAFARLRAETTWQHLEFIADLHLSESAPEVTSLWSDYMRGTSADAVFILGDLFDVWVGDDCVQADSFEATCLRVLQACPVPVYFMPGNRDFLLGHQDFFQLSGLSPLSDPLRLVFGDRVFVLSHGDLLCTADRAYQKWRQQAHDPAWQTAFLTQSLVDRQMQARHMRAESQAHQQAQGVLSAQFDVNDELARAWLLAAGATILIHGHTHRPADHALEPDGQGKPLQRVVLSDWHFGNGLRRAEVLRVSQGGSMQRLAL